MDPVTALATRGGVAEASELKRLGVRARALSAAVSAGFARRVRRGCYALPDADPVAVAEVAWRGRATCITAANACGLPLLGSFTGLHLAIPRGRNHGADHLALPSGIVTHHVTDVDAAGRLDHALDVAALCTTAQQQLVLVDAALAQGAIGISDIQGFTATPARRREYLLRHASALSGSLLETLMGLILSRARLKFRRQVQIRGLGRVDFVVAGRLIVEVDGRATHDTSAQFSEDRRRDRVAVALGYRVLRFTYADVVGRPEDVIADITRALDAPWRPTPPAP